MKTNLGAALLIAASSLLCANADAQKVTVEQYPYIENAPVRMMATLSGLSYTKTTIKSDFTKKNKAVFKCYECVDGILNERKQEMIVQVPGYSEFLFDTKDSVVIEAMLKKDGERNTIEMALNGNAGNFVFAIPLCFELPFGDVEREVFDKNSFNPRILMDIEMGGDMTLDDEIPIFAITCGIPHSGDGEHYGFSYCELRGTGVHPKDWKDIKGIQNYVYYTVKFKE